MYDIHRFKQGYEPVNMRSIGYKLWIFGVKSQKQPEKSDLNSF